MDLSEVMGGELVQGGGAGQGLLFPCPPFPVLLNELWLRKQKEVRFFFGRFTVFVGWFRLSRHFRG
jgi:hypothetical protein